MIMRSFVESIREMILDEVGGLCGAGGEISQQQRGTSTNGNTIKLNTLKCTLFTNTVKRKR